MTSWRDSFNMAAMAYVRQHPDGLRDVVVEFRDAPHDQRDPLDPGMMAVFGFWHGGEWLLFRSAGPNSHPRYQSQHYGVGRAGSTLAGYLAADPRMGGVAGFDPDEPGDWIRANTSRVNVMLPADRGDEAMQELKRFLVDRLQPRYGR